MHVWGVHCLARFENLRAQRGRTGLLGYGRRFGKPGAESAHEGIDGGDFTGMAKMVKALSVGLGSSLVWMMFEDPTLHAH